MIDENTFIYMYIHIYMYNSSIHGPVLASIIIIIVFCFFIYAYLI